MVQATPAGQDTTLATIDEEWSSGSDDAASDVAELPDVRGAQVEADWHGHRLDRWLVQLAPEFSRNHLQTLIERGCVTIDGQAASSASRKLLAGQMVRIELLPTQESQAFRAEKLPLNIIYEDAHLLVLNKAAGMVVHPASGNWSGTVMNGLLAHHPAAATLPRAGIVHRLDKDTTGVMVVAKTPLALHALARQFAARTVAKTYLAIVRGAPRDDEGEIDLAIGRDPVARHRMQARVGQRREARTGFRVVERFGQPPVAALVEATPYTGRTHQVRVHLASIGHPLVGDSLYAGESHGPPAGERRLIDDFPRQALHAARLRLRHPGDGRWIEFAATLPPDMAGLLGELRAVPQRRA